MPGAIKAYQATTGELIPGSEGEETWHYHALGGMPAQNLFKYWLLPVQIASWNQPWQFLTWQLTWLSSTIFLVALGLVLVLLLHSRAASGALICTL